MRNYIRSALLVLVILLGTVPGNAYAANATFFGPLVPAECHCDNQIAPDGTKITTAPDYGCVLQVIQNTINFAVSMGVILFVLYAVFAGFRLVTSGGSPGAREQGRTRIMNVIIGLIVLLCSWLIVDFVMKTLYDEGKFGPWNAILASQSSADRCIVARNPTAVVSGSVGINTTPSAGGTGGGTGVATGATGGSTGMNVASALAYMQQRYSTSNAGGNCWQGVREGLCKGGETQFCTPGGYNAFQAGPHLVQAGFTNVFTGNYSYPASEKAFVYQPGDVIIFQPVAGHPNGHSTMYVGNNTWVSDFTQNGFMAGNKTDYSKGSGSFTVYRP